MERSVSARRSAARSRTTGRDARPSRSEAAGHLRSYVGRQEIVDRDRRVVGHEFLYRDKPGARPTPWDPDAATEHVAAQLLAHHARLVEGRLAFLNVTHSFLVSGSYRRLPPGRTVLEITEDIAVDGRLVDAIVAAAACGYRIALDDYRCDGPHADLVLLADVVKVDLLAAGQSPTCEIPTHVRAINPDATVLGEKVERPVDIDACVASGYDLLQGFAISRPIRITCMSDSRAR